ncbi:hypothetical protein LguiA_010589 [Lonicera macranthoides]
MSNPSPIVEIPEVGNLEIKNPNTEPALKYIATEESEEGEEFWPLSGKPYFDVVLAKSHVHPRYQLSLPNKLHPLLPSATIPAVFTYRGKSWETTFSSKCKQKLVRTHWKSFVDDNDLKVGDACVFELTECCNTHLKFKVQILRGGFPPELLAKVKGGTSDSPIVVE